MKLSLNNASKKRLTQDTGYKKRLKALCILCSLFCACAVLSGAARPLTHKVYIKTLNAGRYQLMVNNRPYIVRGVCYNPIPIGKNHEYDWWSDAHKPWMVDGKRMKEMGINTVRIYQAGEDPEKVKAVIRDLYDNYGIRVILGHWLGFWEYPCPFYGHKDFRDRVKQQVLDMVNLYKDEPGILMWILGNENNYSCLNMVRPWSNDEIDNEPDPQKQKKMRATIYYSFVNELAGQIHAIDPNHPVALGNGELIGLDVANEVCPDVDLVACIIYRGKTFGNLFNSLKATFDKPILLSEFGADCYDAYLGQEDQNMQAFFLQSQWRQIYDNVANSKKGAGNCIGGTMFEWTDEWWKHSESDPESWLVHDTESNWTNGSYYFDIKAKGNKNMNEEWFGIVALSNTEKEEGIDARIPRKAYYVIREFWKNPQKEIKLKR
ncbi:MAG: glycoside hydrolase family 2 TIM barrel-domain containing protein [Candidatus Omnitrophica bacterium]|nr:glycoside hydrolase family 2 TIM barrel-domain containing protein [Candidatus Omnitrophota bacterium]